MPSESSPVRRAWESFTTFGPHHDAHWVALRAGLSTGVPLLLLWGVDRLDLALPAAFGAFAALYGRAHSHRDRAVMQATAAIVLVAGVATGTVLSATAAPTAVVILALAAMAAVATIASRAWAWHPPGVVFPVFSVGATANVPATGHEVLTHTAVAAAVAGFAIAVGAIGALTPSRRRPRQSWDAPLRAALRSRQSADDVVRTTLAVAGAAILATLLGLGHAYWASVGAAAATSGPTAEHRIVRGLHRAVGTVAGVLVAAALLALDPGELATILVVIVLSVVAELLVGRHYAVALVAITPLALLMVHLGSPEPATHLLEDRVVDTILGVAVGMLVVLAWDRPLSRGRRGSR